MKKIIFFLFLILLAVFFYQQNFFFKSLSTNVEQGVLQADIETIENLNIPWELEFLPNNELLITERTGTLLKIGKEKQRIEIKGVKHRGEGGLLGMALHPKFEENSYIYLYFTSEAETGLENRIERYKLINNKLEDRKVILEGIPGAAFHDGGRIRFGPDKKLYITTGDAGNSDSAQNLNSLAGKILRINDDGSLPEDNPFNTSIYSYGHRNPQGITWDEQGRLWSTEHGRSGLKSGFDELNIIEKGKNYGWPEIQGDEQKEKMVSPIIHSGPDETWAPASALFYEGKIFFTGLRGEALYEYDIKTQQLKAHFRKEFGRLRTIRENEGVFYILTSNTDGRGTKGEGDDKIIKIKYKELN